MTYLLGCSQSPPISSISYSLAKPFNMWNSTMPSQRFLSVLAPAGRLVILIPNSDCPVVNRVTNRFEHKYDGVSMIGLRKRLSHLTRDYYVAYRGIHFRQDQVIAPYQSGPWQQIISDSAPKSPHISVKTGSVAQIPNRVQVAIVKSGGEPFQKILSTA